MSDEELLNHFEASESKDETPTGLIGGLLPPNLLLVLSCSAPAKGGETGLS